MNTAVLFLIFNRPAETRIVLEQLRRQQVRNLYVAADGPRANNEKDIRNCAECRELIDSIDWDCNVVKLFRNENLGCGRAVSDAITWFFSHEEMGIILEDDCLPSDSFFMFCSTLLHYYKNEPGVMHISGDNFQFGKSRGAGTYYFSIYAHVWGWATWRRAWQLYDFTMKDFPEIIKDSTIRNYYPGDSLAQTYEGKIDTWDFQWVYTILRNRGLSIIPNVNLVKNIGFNKKSTHTNRAPFWYSKIVTGEIDEIVHPDKIEIDSEADNFTLKNIYLAKESFLNRVLRKVTSLLTGS